MIEIQGEKPLLIVDGYNLMHCSDRYRELIDEPGRAPLYSDPFIRSRERVLTDVASWAQNRYEAHIVYDAADNLHEEHPSNKSAGVWVHYSQRGESADYVIEQQAQRALYEGRDVLIVTSDSTIRASISQDKGRLQFISSTNFVREIAMNEHEVHEDLRCTPSTKMTFLSRLSKEQQDKLRNLLKKLN